MPVPTAGNADPGRRELVPIWTQSLESSRKEKSGPAVVTVRSWGKGWGTIRKGAGAQCPRTPGAIRPREPCMPAPRHSPAPPVLP